MVLKTCLIPLAALNLLLKSSLCLKYHCFDHEVASICINDTFRTKFLICQLRSGKQAFRKHPSALSSDVLFHLRFQAENSVSVAFDLLFQTDLLT